MADIRRLSLSLFYPYRDQADMRREMRLREKLVIDAHARRVTLHTRDPNGQGRTTSVLCGRGELTPLLRMAAGALRMKDWIAKLDPVDQDMRFVYRLRAEFYGGRVVTRHGAYLRSHMPDAWVGFMRAVDHFLERGRWSELLDVSRFADASKPGEMKYCAVAYSARGSAYAYRTDIEDIQEGDFVIVPVGKENTERVGMVEKIGYYRRDNAPYPPEQTKWIVRVVDDDEVDAEEWLD